MIDLINNCVKKFRQKCKASNLCLYFAIMWKKPVFKLLNNGTEQISLPNKPNKNFVKSIILYWRSHNTKGYWDHYQQCYSMYPSNNVKTMQFFSLFFYHLTSKSCFNYHHITWYNRVSSNQWSTTLQNNQHLH